MKLWTSLLFLEGALTDVALVRELAAEPADPAVGTGGASDLDAPGGSQSSSNGNPPPSLREGAGRAQGRSYGRKLAPKGAPTRGVAGHP